MRYTLIAVVLLLGACGDAKKQFDESFKASFEKSFVESCVKGAKDSGAPEEKMPEVNRLCACTAQGLLAKHTAAELVTMNAGGGDQSSVQAAVQACMK